MCGGGGGETCGCVGRMERGETGGDVWVCRGNKDGTGGETERRVSVEVGGGGKSGCVGGMERGRRRDVWVCRGNGTEGDGETCGCVGGMERGETVRRVGVQGEWNGGRR